VANIRKPTPTKGRNRRLIAGEERTLFEACDSHSNPKLGWIARIARIALYTCMRAGEIKLLTRRQVNLHKRTVHLRPQDSSRAGRFRQAYRHEITGGSSGTTAIYNYQR
jgi:integrase